ncbi:MAG: dienelactone hydrolase [Phycisphaerales bacterium]|jgi:dienelactone hydrolase
MRTNKAIVAGLMLETLLCGVALAGPPTASERVAAVVQAAETRGHSTATLKQIMADPGWVARSPAAAFWADDGSAVYYTRERSGDEGIRDTWVIRFDADANASEPEIVPDEELDSIPTQSGDTRQIGEHRHKVYLRGNAFWLKNLDTGSERLLMNTSGRRGRPSFVRGGAAIAWPNNAIFVRDLASGLVEEPIRVLVEDEPKELEDQWTEQDKEQDDLEDQQERLFEIIRDRERRSRAREASRRLRSEANEFAIPTVYLGSKHLGTKIQNVGMNLNEDTRWLGFLVQEDVEDAERDIMPIYVTADGNVDTQKLRPKVGLTDRGQMWVALIDIENETAHWLDWGELPGIRDDPLAWLKDKMDEEEEKEDASDSTSDGMDAPSDTEPTDDAEHAETDERPLRDVRTMGWSWNDDGSNLAVMVRSTDNKDRWLITVDVSTGDPEMTVVEHQREEGWVNYRYNQFDWLPDGRLWYTSEASGYGGLYLWNGETASRLSGEGEFTVQSVSDDDDGGFLYYRSNRTHPTEYELERVNTSTGMVQAVTGMGSSVDSYSLSPNGDRVLITHSTAMAPPELYVASADGSGDPTRLTRTDTEEFRSFDWIEPEFVEVPSTHADAPIHARVYDDPDAPSRNEGESKPVVVFVHGAGYTQHVYKGWSYYFREHLFHTLLARAGYIVIAPDFRASAGYGSQWRQAIYRNMGEPELQDLDDCLAWLKDERGADTSRVGIYGGSYGGFLAIMAMFDRPGVYAAGAALRPVTDWAHYNDGYTANILNTPQLDPEAYLKSSPIEKAESFEGRLLLLHGMLDDNVVFQDSVRLAQRLIELEKENWELVAFPVEAHGFAEPTGWLHEYRKIFRMFEEELGED